MANRFQGSSLSQTMAQMRRRYNTRSAGGSTTPYTPYTPGEMPPAPTVALTLTDPDTVTRGDSATYTARITPAGLSLNTTLMFEWKYTTAVRDDRDAVSITERIDATSENPQSAAWSGTMVSGGTLEVRTTVNGTKLVQTMDVKVNKRAWVTDVPICTDTTSLGAEAPRSHTDLGDVEYDILFSPAHDLETATVSSGPNKGILYTTAINLNAPLIVKINRHFRMAVADLPPTWVAFKNANTLYGEIEAKVKARLGFDGTTNGTLYGDWVSEINDNNPEANIEEFMEVPNRLRSDYETQIVDRVEGLRTSRKAGMTTRISGWSPSGITINYNYFAAYAGEDQAVDVNTTATFDGSSSGVSAGRTIKKYSWNFGLDADPATGSGDKPRCTYSTPGEKTVTLTVTDSADDTDSDTMTIIVRNPSARHDAIPFGMMGIQDEQLTGLEETFQSIYVGDSNFSHPACNHLHSYGHNFDVNNRWGLTPGYFAIAPDGSDIRDKRPMRHAKAWANFVKKASDVNGRLGGAKLKCLISNRLMHLYRGQDPNYLNWDVDELQTFVRQTIQMIDEDITPTRSNPNPKDIVAGWYLDDDGLKNDVHNVERWSEVVEAVHSAQKACCVNWPFYFADNVDDEPFWNEAATQFTIPQKLKDWVRAFPPDATPIFMPYYYPWLSNNWNYTENPPWKKWKMYIDKLHEAFFNPDGTAKIHDNLKFHPVLEASEHMTMKTSEEDPNKEIRVASGHPLPGHADMHKQIRVVWNLLQEYDSVTGIWFLGWNIDDGVATSRATAHNNWTVNPGETEADSGVAKSRRWAEAIQNEPHATEGILEAVPDISKVYPAFTVRNIPGKRIPYSLSERKRFEIRIYDGNIDENPNAKLVRTLDEGYDGVSPQGEFRNSNHVPYRYEELRGTSAYWDGSKDIETDANLYFAYLFLDGQKVHGPQRITL